MEQVTAHDLKQGSYIMIEDIPCMVRKVDISKTGKHGASKARIEAMGIIDGKKRIIAKPGHEKFIRPLIEKKKGQVLSVTEKVSIMDVESYETLEAIIPEEFKGKLQDGMSIEYWNVEGTVIVKRIF